ncbi:group III truncated hemoglobin [Mucilaginibacter sp. L3T2-6]|uniref:group III truncated hemoglobin n=1 Tax=Mucilaginibacter sp. L3T2-6 TaxID=3062491 RepID=UPI0026770811|nr:group III truncated hemoglobin [Mucilaginibacter sp. L3T2-6]MDO3641382.1 group III truncated hemoglobin [Mucilaginibacter sp. L3T2-6]MDV6213857.1 group III truncated hemoglobin [Mucilaginibacter sp. L3T2-6]
MKDIATIEDIKVFVNEFYAKVQEDDLIGPVFLQVIGDWQPHLEKMYAFWNAVLFGVAGFKGNPFAKHAPLKIGQHHFDRWLILFGRTIDTHFEGPVADDTKNRAGLMAEMFLHKLRYMADAKRVIV